MHYLSKGAATTPDDSLERAAVEAYRLQKQQQSQASGYDIITQWQGGIVSLVPTPNHWPGTITPYSSGAIDTLNHYVHILVGGKGAPTKTVMNATLDWLQENRALPKLAEISEDMIEEFDHGLTHGQFDSDALKRLFCLFKQHRHTFVGSPCYPESIVSILEAIPDCDSNWSFKTTGAGGEDALILLGPKEILPGVLEHLHPFGWELSPFQFSSVGSQIDFSHEVNL
jgi:mevalonate kinase